MNNGLNRNLGLVFLQLMLCCISMNLFASEPDDAPLFDIPKLKNIVIDGNPNDWDGHGYCVNILSAMGPRQPTSDFDVNFRLGWDERGLLALVRVCDDIHVEHNEDEFLWKRDSLEFFIAPSWGAHDVVKVTLSPGLDNDHPWLRYHFENNRDSGELEEEELSIQAVRSKTTRLSPGYVLEVLLPWKNLKIDPKNGHEIAFQIYARDFDSREHKSFSLWHSQPGVSNTTAKMNRLRLSNKTSSAVRAVAQGDYDGFSYAHVRLTGEKSLAGTRVKINDVDRTLATTQWIASDGWSVADIYLPMLPLEQSYGRLTVPVEHGAELYIELGNVGEKRAKALMTEELNFDPYVFSGNQFPKCQFDRPQWIRALLGPYSLKTTFYDAHGNRVLYPEEPGRYGAVIEINPDKGRVQRRFRTLFRSPENFSWWHGTVPISIEFPPELGIKPQIAAEHVVDINEYLRLRMGDDCIQKQGAAILLAGLYEARSESGTVGRHNDVYALDRQWWIDLRRKLYAMEPPKQLLRPSLIVGEPARTLREGTIQEAEIRPGSIEKIDWLCREWEDDSDEAFAVCLVRHGVVFFHKAYGQRYGKSMSVDTRSWMASITKMLSASLVMMFADQELLSLDDPIDRYLPAFRGIEVKTPLTLRHLLTHTNGLWGWGNDESDFDEIIAGYYPYLEVGKRVAYNGSGIALSGKIMEAITGKVLPKLYKEHLLDPLGCTNTDVNDTSGRSFSIPLNIAKVAQMLLNRGAYETQRFFSETTFEKMIPGKLTQVLGPSTNVERGLGLVWMDKDKKVFGHGAASSATLQIDPGNDLIVIITRNAAGENFGRYYHPFLRAVYESLDGKFEERIFEK